jgi:hypothetical protein
LGGIEMRNPGMYLELKDGRRGIAYKKEQVHPDRLTIKLVDGNFAPIISDLTGKQKIVFKASTDVKLIGYVD